MSDRTLLTEREVKRFARQFNVEPEVLCTTCGRVAYVADHFGHRVTRIWMDAEAEPEVTRPKMPPPPPRIEWLTIADCARELGVSKMTAYRLVHTGDLPAHKFGRQFRVDRIALDIYVRGTVIAVVATEDDDQAVGA